MTKPELTLVSHALCPYVQRAAISLAEKAVPFKRIDVDLAARPAWFTALSPLGKVPLLKVGETVLFESSVILEYLEDTQAPALHPADPLERARHRAMIEFASAILTAIAGFYAAPDAATFEARRAELADRFAFVERQVDEGPWFAGVRFSLVDAAFAPVFRYFDAFDKIGDFAILAGKPKLAAWRSALRTRFSAQDAVGADYPDRLAAFLRARGSHLSRLMEAAPALVA